MKSNIFTVDDSADIAISVNAECIREIETQIIIPENDDSDLEQKQAYQDFISVLSAILLKYAAEIELNS